MIAFAFALAFALVFDFALALVFAASLVPTSSFSEDETSPEPDGTLFAFFFFAGGVTRADSFVFAFLVLSCVPFVE